MNLGLILLLSVFTIVFLVMFFFMGWYAYEADQYLRKKARGEIE